MILASLRCEFGQSDKPGLGLEQEIALEGGGNDDVRGGELNCA